MPNSEMSGRRYFFTVGAIFAAAAFCGIVALCSVLVRRFLSGETIAPIALAVFGLALLISVFARKPTRSPNYPRIEHLRIAGKYSPSGGADTGISPLPRWKRYFHAAAVILAVAGFCGIAAWCVILERRVGTGRTIMPMLLAVFGLRALISALAHKPSRSPNYPRIEHLRISGKYSPAGAADVGISPLHLQ